MKLNHFIKCTSIVFVSAFIACPGGVLRGQMLPGSVHRTAQPMPSWNHQLSPSTIAPASLRVGQNAAPVEMANAPPMTDSPLGSDYFHHPGQTQNQYGCSTAACGSDICGACDQDTCPCRYVKFFGGWNFMEDVDAMFGTANIPGTLDINDGWVFGTAIGSYVAPDLRRELEFTYRDNTGNGLIDGGVMIGDLSGRVQTYSLMGNIIRDFRSRSGGLKPYVGGGLGIAFVDADLAWMGETFIIDDAAFAYQAIAGVQRPMSHRMSAFVEYRFFGTLDLELESAAGTTRQPYNAHNVILGIQLMR